MFPNPSPISPSTAQPDAHDANTLITLSSFFFPMSDTSYYLIDTCHLPTIDTNATAIAACPPTANTMISASCRSLTNPHHHNCQSLSYWAETLCFSIFFHQLIRWPAQKLRSCLSTDFALPLPSYLWGPFNNFSHLPFFSFSFPSSKLTSESSPSTRANLTTFLTLSTRSSKVSIPSLLVLPYVDVVGNVSLFNIQPFNEPSSSARKIILLLLIRITDLLHPLSSTRHTSPVKFYSFHNAYLQDVAPQRCHGSHCHLRSRSLCRCSLL